MYRKCAKRILGVPDKTSGIAALVRLGWLPLDYVLAYHGLRWYMRIKRQELGSRLNKKGIEILGSDKNIEYSEII